jgi:hypothetical protein
MTRFMVDADVLVWVLRGKAEAVAWLEAAGPKAACWARR